MLLRSSPLSPPLSRNPKPFPLPLRTHLPISPSLRSTPLVSSLSSRGLATPSSSGSPVVAEAVIGSGNGEDEEGEEEPKYVEVGYISSAHGLRGEVRVMPSTDFPELRFAKPGKRWLRTRAAGKELIKEVELTGGRGHPGQKSWIISFSGIDTVEEARQIVGSSLLVTVRDRPELEEGEFYTRDLVGMRVILKETGKLVGTVANVFNYGASDLLHVMLHSAEERPHQSNLLDQDDSSSAPHIWIPFVEAIVPDVDADRREMQITPPKGLLELNLRCDVRSKKERRQMEWKERRKLQQRLVATKKILAELDQKHILEGLRIGEKNQKTSLAKQLTSIDFRLFQQAIQNIKNPFISYSLSEYINGNSSALLKNPMRISHQCLISGESEGNNNLNYELRKVGLQLLRNSKVAIILVRHEEDDVERGSETDDVRVESAIIQFKNLFSNLNIFLKEEENNATVPFILVSPAREIEPYKECLVDNDYFGLNSQKVWVLEEEKLPIVNISPVENSHEILLKSPWEILQAPIGPGGIFSLLSSHKIIDALNEFGVEYVQICSLDNRTALGHPLFFGFVSSRGADVGIKLSTSCKTDDNFDMVISMKHVNKMSKEINRLRFRALPEQHVHVHVQQVKDEWITVHPEKPNSYRLHCPIYSILNPCSLDNVCVMEVDE
ncbi:Ribosome maturation factor RimM [Ananas comosus]|uniref:Ribosome maturation factor RimM n=1 Tax=Ananas comosus TaxID=4615 RepID=A0A199V2L4_ANACO|nr:Ribosome maturation factor RimM [Ananas comosus]